MINLLVIDMSHYDMPVDYPQIKAAGIAGIIYKCSQGTSYVDPTYTEQRSAALGMGFLWGAFHFGDNTNVAAQVNNFLSHAQLTPKDLFCLDYEDYPESQMTIQQTIDWTTQVEGHLGRPTQGIIYSGDTIKDTIRTQDYAFWGARRLWLAQYGPSPSFPQPWSSAWLWQYTDGTVGPAPRTVNGVGQVDCNSYSGSSTQLSGEWATGQSVIKYCSCCHQPLPT